MILALVLWGSNTLPHSGHTARMVPVTVIEEGRDLGAGSLVAGSQQMSTAVHRNPSKHFVTLCRMESLIVADFRK
jgi:hypothetical protein